MFIQKVILLFVIAGYSANIFVSYAEASRIYDQYMQKLLCRYSDSDFDYLCESTRCSTGRIFYRGNCLDVCAVDVPLCTLCACPVGTRLVGNICVSGCITCEQQYLINMRYTSCI